RPPPTVLPFAACNAQVNAAPNTLGFGAFGGDGNSWIVPSAGILSNLMVRVCGDPAPSLQIALQLDPAGNGQWATAPLAATFVGAKTVPEPSGDQNPVQVAAGTRCRL